MPDGSVFVLSEEKDNAEPTPARGATKTDPLSKPINSASDNNKPQNDGDVKHKNSVSDSVSDRSLLLEAAEREGAGASEELRRFANRVKDLEGLQRRLERQERKLVGLTTPHQSASQTASTRRARSPQGEANEGERAELEERIRETRELITKTEERIDRMEKGAKLQREAECNCFLHAPPLNLGASEGAPCRATLISFGTEETIN